MWWDMTWVIWVISSNCVLLVALPSMLVLTAIELFRVFYPIPVDSTTILVLKTSTKHNITKLVYSPLFRPARLSAMLPSQRDPVGSVGLLQFADADGICHHLQGQCNWRPRKHLTGTNRFRRCLRWWPNWSNLNTQTTIIKYLWQIPAIHRSA